MTRQKVARANPLLKKTRSIKDCSTGNWSYEFQIFQIDGSKNSRTGDGRRCSRRYAAR